MDLTHVHILQIWWSPAWQWSFYCSFEVEGVAIFVNNSQGEQLTQLSIVAFYVWPAACGTTIDHQIQISLFAHLAMQNVKSAFDWSIAVQFGINLHSWYIALQYIL